MLGPQDATTHMVNGFSLLSQNLLGNILTGIPEFSLLGDPKSNPVDREDDYKVFQKDIMVSHVHTDLNI